MPHGVLGGHAATHPQQIAGVSSLLELVSSIINITLQVGRFYSPRSARWCKGWDLNPRFPNYQFGALPTWPPLHKKFSAPNTLLTRFHHAGLLLLNDCRQNLNH